MKRLVPIAIALALPAAAIGTLSSSAEAARTKETAAVDHGLLDRARGDADRAMTGLLRSIGFREVHVEWKKD